MHIHLVKQAPSKREKNFSSAKKLKVGWMQKLMFLQVKNQRFGRQNFFSVFIVRIYCKAFLKSFNLVNRYNFSLKEHPSKRIYDTSFLFLGVAGFFT
jgi:hypothetical protein